MQLNCQTKWNVNIDSYNQTLCDWKNFGYLTQTIGRRRWHGYYRKHEDLLLLVRHLQAFNGLLSVDYFPLSSFFFFLLKERTLHNYSLKFLQLFLSQAKPVASRLSKRQSELSPRHFIHFVTHLHIWLIFEEILTSSSFLESSRQ